VTKSRKNRWTTTIAVVLVTAALGVPTQAAGTARPTHVTAHSPAPTSALDECGRAGLEIAVQMPGSAGGYSCAPTPYDDEVMAAAQALVTEADETMPAAAPRQYLKVKSAATQVVAGVNYKLVVRVWCARPETLIGTVYVALDDSSTVTSLFGLAG
jgi:hypothetical protein